MPVDNRMVVLTTAAASTTAADATALIASSGANNILIGELAINSNTGNLYAGCEVGEAGAAIGGSAGKSTATSDILGMTLSTASTMQAVGTGASPTFAALTVSGGNLTTEVNASGADGQDMTITAGMTTAGANDDAGGDLTIKAGAGTGEGDGGSIIFQTANAAGSSATTVNAHATALTLADDLSATFAGAVTGITDLSITGDLNITGDINSTSVTDLDVTDKTITIAKGAADSSAADGAGIVVDGASASLLYDHTGTQWEFNKPVEIIGALNIGVDDTGHDVKFFGATSGAYMLWDESADDLVLAGAAGLDIAGDIDVDGTANLDAVDIDGAVQADSTITVGEDDTGYDVKFFGATSGAYMLWDESADDLVLAGAAGLDIAGDIDVDGTANLDAVDIDGAVQADSTITVGEDDTGYDVKFFGATSGAYMLWDESADDLVLAGAAGIDLAGDLDVDGTTNLDAVDIDGAVQADSTITVGVDNTGYDVKFFGATTGKSMLWDESADKLIVTGDMSVSGTLTATVANATNAANVYLNTDDTGDASCSIVFTQDAGGANRALYEDSGLLYNNTTNYITCGGLTGATISGGTF